MRHQILMVAVLALLVPITASVIEAAGTERVGEKAVNEGRGGITWASGFESALEEAQIDGKLVMVDFFTDWCGWCRKLDADTYRDPEVAAHAGRLVCVKVNAEQRKDISRRYGVRGYPSIAFLHSDGTLVDMVRGYLPPKQFVAALDRISDPAVEKFTLVQRLKDHPDLIDVRCDLARLLIRCGETSMALAQIDTCLQARSQIDETRRWDLRLDRAHLLLALGHSLDARRDLKEYLDRRNKSARHAEALYLYAEASLATGDKKEARKSYRKLLSERPDGWLAERSRSRLSELG